MKQKNEISFLTQPDDDIEIQRHRLIWLVKLRWIGVVSVVMATLIGEYVLGLHLPMLPLFLIAGVMAAYNLYFKKKANQPEFDRRIALRQIVLDVLGLTAVLFLSGGFLNPFFTFYFFIVILASIILRVRESIFIIVLVTICFVSQGFSSRVVDINMKLGEGGLLNLGEMPFHVIGAPISFVLTTLITAYFTSVIMGDLRKREWEVQSARQQTELELNKLDNLLDRLDAGMLVFDSKNLVERVNDRMVSWFGPEGQNDDTACYLISQYGKNLEREWTSEGEPESRHFFEARLPTLSEGVRDFEIMVTPIRDASGKSIQRIELILDVTDQKKSQAQWAQAQKLAAIGQLAAGVAHEINTPLGTINILTEEAKALLQEVVEQPQPEQKKELEESLETIHDQVRRCKEVTQGLLNFSRAQEHKMDSVSLNAIAHRAIELIRHRVSGVHLVKELAAHLPEISTDVHGVERAVFNLLLNAADALDGVEREKRIRVKTLSANNTVGIQIIDNGKGIPEEDMPHVTEPFFTTKTVGKGTGLGLYVAYGAIHDLGGRLELESQYGEGTTASIWLPIETNDGNENKLAIGR